jgi:gliding motility-associated-like protein
VTVTAANGCTSTSSITISENFILSNASISEIQPTCATPTGQIVFDTPVPDGLIQYYLVGINPITAPLSNSSGVFQNIPPGQYELYYTLNNCQSNFINSQLIPVTVPSQPTVLVTNPTCDSQSGSIETTFPISLSGNSITYTLTGINPPIPAQSNFTGIFSSIAPGDYTLVATENGCSSAISNVSVIQGPTEPNAPQLQIIQPSCNNILGTVNIISPPQGASTVYQLTLISPLGNSVSTNSNFFTGLTSGTYELNVTVNGCVSQASVFTINEVILPPTPIINIVQPSCEFNYGSVTVVNSDPTITSYTLIPTNPAGNPQTNSSGIFTNLSSGTFNVFITASGCNSTFTQAVILPTLVLPTLIVNSPTVCEGETVTITAQGTPSGGTYAWQGTGITSNSITTTATSSENFEVTYTFNGCSTQVQSILTVIPIPAIEVTGGQICAGDELMLQPIVSVPGGTFAWEPTGSTASSITVAPEQSTVFSVTYTVGQCESVADTALVVVNDYPQASFIPSTYVFSDYSEQVEFYNTSSGAVSYIWDFGDGDSSSMSNPTHQYVVIDEDGYIVTLIALNEAGCPDTTSVKIDHDILIYYVPNTFTPDGNSVNQVFKPVFTDGFDPFQYGLYIYNRWGELIFESHNADFGWDGAYGIGENARLCQDGTYVWKIDFKRRNNDETITITGHVNLIR